jgi:hypothetical protein
MRSPRDHVKDHGPRCPRLGHGDVSASSVTWTLTSRRRAPIGDRFGPLDPLRDPSALWSPRGPLFCARSSGSDRSRGRRARTIRLKCSSVVVELALRPASSGPRPSATDRATALRGEELGDTGCDCGAGPLLLSVAHRLVAARLTCIAGSDPLPSLRIQTEGRKVERWHTSRSRPTETKTP